RPIIQRQEINGGCLRILCCGASSPSQRAPVLPVSWRQPISNGGLCAWSSLRCRLGSRIVWNAEGRRDCRHSPCDRQLEWRTIPSANASAQPYTSGTQGGPRYRSRHAIFSAGPKRPPPRFPPGPLQACDLGRAPPPSKGQPP
ncbi:unnamed protein product, partial [Amoebophrya sp. A120]